MRASPQVYQRRGPYGAKRRCGDKLEQPRPSSRPTQRKPSRDRPSSLPCRSYGLSARFQAILLPPSRPYRSKAVTYKRPLSTRSGRSANRFKGRLGISAYYSCLSSTSCISKLARLIRCNPSFGQGSDCHEPSGSVFQSLILKMSVCSQKLCRVYGAPMNDNYLSSPAGQELYRRNSAACANPSLVYLRPNGQCR